MHRKNSETLAKQTTSRVSDRRQLSNRANSNRAVVHFVRHTQTGVNTFFSSQACQLRSQFQCYITKYY